MAGAPNTHVCYHPRRTARREKARLMAEANAKLTPQQKLANLDEWLGVGVGAKKERARLAKQIRGAS